MKIVPMERIELYGCGPAELGVRMGGSGRGVALWRRIREGEDPFDVVGGDGPSARRLREHCLDLPARFDGVVRAQDGTAKLRLRLRDDLRVETVLIPGRGRTTICVSSQVGCARECVFCVTATMGLLRSLSIAEIVAQVVLGRRVAAGRRLPPARNVVFMGMGEPLDNLDATLAAVRLLVDPRALGLAPRHVTLSTVGTSPAAIRRLASTPALLAWSIHAVDDDLRRCLVPAGRHAMVDLRAAFLDVIRARRSMLFVEMTLLDGVNDDVAQAEALAAFLEPFGRAVRINLLAMNPGRAEHRPSPRERVVSYRQELRRRGFFCAIREPRGAGQMAACGQLALGSGHPS